MPHRAPLIVAAVAPEFDPLPGYAIGIGPVVAGITLARLLAERRIAGDLPGAVILLGTAGSLPGGPPILSVVRAGRMGMADPLAASGTGYVPLPPADLQGQLPPGMPGLAGLPVAAALTNLGVTTDPAAAARYAAAGWQVEHMECMAAALACAAEGVPFCAILAVSNAVGPDAHAQWRANRAEAQRRAVAAITRIPAIPG